MGESTDLDLAIAVALAENNDAFSDDDFKPSARRMELDQQFLLQTYRSSCPIPKKRMKKKSDKKQMHPAVAARGTKGHCAVEDFSTNVGEQKVGVGGTKGAVYRENTKSAVNGDVKRSAPLSVTDLDKFYLLPDRVRGADNVAALEETVPPTKDSMSEEASTTKLNSLTVVRSPLKCDGQHVSAIYSTAGQSQDDCSVIDINSEEVVELDNETQFSILLKLCGEEHVEDEHRPYTPIVSRFSYRDDASPGCCISSLVEPAVGKGVPGPNAVVDFTSISEQDVLLTPLNTVGERPGGRDSDVKKDVGRNIEGDQADLSYMKPGNDGQKQLSSRDQCWEDDISSMMTQQCLPQKDVESRQTHLENNRTRLSSPHQLPREKSDDMGSMMSPPCLPVSPIFVKATYRTSSSPLQNISNLAPSVDMHKQRMKGSSVNQAAIRLDLSCILSEDSMSKNKLGMIDYVLQADQTDRSSQEDPCQMKRNMEDLSPIISEVQQPGINGDAGNRLVCSESDLPVVEGVSHYELDEEIIKCPVCGDNISDISVEDRLTHTNSCLDKLDPMQECPEQKGNGNPPSLVAGSDQVRDWLETLNLSRYISLFVQQEIDWDTLQWLTEEDLVVMGITAVGPRRKILSALQELKTGSGASTTNPSNTLLGPSPAVDPVALNPQVHIPAVVSISRNPQVNGGESNNLITNYFPLPPGIEKQPLHDMPAKDTVGQSIIGGKQQAVFKNKASKRPRSSVYRNVSGIPAWMCIPGTPFRVDAFQHLSGDCCHWFLTHFHTDHYQGLTRGFRYGHIFCSLITARLVNLRIGVSWDKLMIMPLNEKFKIAGVDVTFIDANHCPGAVMILFEPPNGEAVLHTGDFRFCPEMTNNTLLQSLHIHTLVLDTTYCDPQYDFPTQETVIRFIIEAIQAEVFNSDTLFLIGTYTIGKERIFLEVAKVLRKYVYVGTAKKKLLDCMDLTADDTKWLTCNEHESFIHVVPLWSISSFKRMSSISRHYQGRYRLIVAFSPSGWSFGRGKKKTPGKRWQQGTMIRYEVPYSEHSSFSELKEFLRFIGPEDIIPSVPAKSGIGTDGMIASLWSEDN